MLHPRDRRIALTTLVATLLTFPCLLGCEGENSAEVLGSADAAITCSVSRGSIAAGSTEPVVVTVQVTRDGIGSPGERVQFESNIGDVAPDAVFTGADGFASSNFFPPATPGGVATILARVVDGSDEVVASCEVSITAGTSDPLLSVTVQTPPQLAGLSVTVTYNTGNVDLPAGGVELLGDFAGGDCLSLVDDDETGTVQVVVTCPTLRPAAGADAMRFGFDNIGGTIVGIEAFGISCSGVDEAGASVGTICSGRVTQL